MNTSQTMLSIIIGFHAMGAHSLNITGTDGKDICKTTTTVLPGYNTLANSTADADVIEGKRGRDILWGGDGFDTIRGGRGDDQLVGQAGDDSILGGSENDYIRGDDGNDYIEGNKGNDALHGNDGDDTIKGGRGDDSLYGGAGTDDLDGGPGNNVIVAMNGSNIIRIADASEADITTGPGDDQFIVEGSGRVVINDSGGANSLLFDGFSESDILVHHDSEGVIYSTMNENLIVRVMNIQGSHVAVEYLFQQFDQFQQVARVNKRPGAVITGPIARKID